MGFNVNIYTYPMDLNGSSVIFWFRYGYYAADHCLLLQFFGYYNSSEFSIVSFITCMWSLDVQYDIISCSISVLLYGQPPMICSFSCCWLVSLVFTCCSFCIVVWNVCCCVYCVNVYFHALHLSSLFSLWFCQTANLLWTYLVQVCQSFPHYTDGFWLVWIEISSTL